MTLCNLYLKLLMQKKKPTKVWLWFIICFYWNMHNFSQHTCTVYVSSYIRAPFHRYNFTVTIILLHNLLIFTALHVMQTWYCEENSVCPSVRPSVCLSVTRVIPDKMEERSVQIFIPYKRTFILVFWEEEWLVGATPSTWNFGSTDPR